MWFSVPDQHKIYHLSILSHRPACADDVQINEQHTQHTHSFTLYNTIPMHSISINTMTIVNPTMSAEKDIVIA